MEMPKIHEKQQDNTGDNQNQCGSTENNEISTKINENTGKPADINGTNGKSMKISEDIMENIGDPRETNFQPLPARPKRYPRNFQQLPLQAWRWQAAE